MLLRQILVVGELAQLDVKVFLVDLPLGQIPCLPKLLLLLLKLDLFLLVFLREAVPDFNELELGAGLTFSMPWISWLLNAKIIRMFLNQLSVELFCTRLQSMKVLLSSLYNSETLPK